MSSCRRLKLVGIAGLIAVLLSSFVISIAPESVDAHLCARGNFHAVAQNAQIGAANGTAGRAGWHEQNFELHEGGSHGPVGTFVVTTMWLVFPDHHWNEIGFGRQDTAPYFGYHFYRAHRNAAGYNEINLNKTPSGAFTWHHYRIEYLSSNGAWNYYIDGDWFGANTNVSNTALRMDVGGESSDQCSVLHITEMGSASPSALNAFAYKTQAGNWTAWTNGSHATDPPFNADWLNYPIRGRVWGP